MNNPKISVIMAAHNSEKYISEAIESILNQTFKNFELIIINDASKDKTLEMIKKYAKRDKRIIVINNIKNLGPASSRNTAIKISKGEYIAIMDSDDISIKDRLEYELGYLNKNTNVFLIGGSYEYIDEKGKTISKEIQNYNSEDLIKKLPYTGALHNPTTMFRNTGKLYFRKKFKYAQDHDFWLRLLTSGKKMVTIPKIVLKYRINPNAISQSKKPYQKLFFEKGTSFYFERLKLGKDSYRKFNPKKEIFSLIDNSNREYTKELIIKKIFTRKGNMPLFRKEIKKYWKDYGFWAWKISIIMFIISFMPKIFIKFSKKLANRINL